MSLNAVLAAGLSAIQTNSTALRVTSNNIANVNTEGYRRRVVQQEPLAPGGQLGGVGLAQIQRVVSEFLSREVLDASASAARFGAQTAFMDRLDAALGQPGDGSSIGAKIDALYAALGQASLDPNALASRQGTMTAMQSLAQTISGLSSSLADLRRGADRDLSGVIGQANSLIEQIHALNPQIQRAFLAGDTATGLLDQRDQLVGQLSELVGVRTVARDDGRLFVYTQDGIALVDDNYARLGYQATTGSVFNPVTVQAVHGATSEPIGNALPFDSHSGGGQIRGLLDMRDNVLAGLGEELGALAQTVALAFNAQHNANAAIPPPASLIGRDTGLLATDSLNFSGIATIGLADASGVLAHRLVVDFDAGTLSADGGAPVSIVGSVGSFVTALNAALGSNGSASFSGGVLTLSANAGNGLVIAGDAANPAARAGTGFSHFFGLNDLFRAEGNSVLATGLAASDAGGFAPGGAMTFVLKGPAGERAGPVTVNVTGSTVGDMIAALNTAFSGKASFALDPDGKLAMTPAAQYSAYDLEVLTDSTTRGATGHSFTSLFGLGRTQMLARAGSFQVNPAVAASSYRLAFAQPSLTAVTALGQTIVTNGDNRGLMALQDIANRRLDFAPAGDFPARSSTLSDYIASFYQDVASRGALIANGEAAQQTRLEQASTRQSATEGVNLDEELSNMMSYQQAYNAGARLLRVVQELLDELLNAV